MRKRYKIGMFIIVILTLIVASLGVIKIFMKSSEVEKNTTSIISNISDYSYTLDDRDTKYMHDEFKNLESILNKKEIDEKEYAKSLAKLFVIDFYTLDNKINKYDVGSLEYIYTDKVEMFKLKAMDTIYNDIIDNTYNDRVQDLPEITNVEIIELEETNVNLNEEEVPSYKISMKYTYKKDLGYDKEGTIYLIKNNNKLEVVNYEPTTN